MHASSISNLILSLVVAHILHEIGHLLAARACKIRVTEAAFGWGPLLFGAHLQGVHYQLRLLPLGAHVRMDMKGLQRRPLSQQLFVLLAGIAVNFILAAIAWGSFFGALNLVLAIGNLFPLYQQDGWKSGMVIFRRVFGRPNPLVEWSFTISGVVVGFAVLAFALFSL
ncbi:MAG: site-2 protease family protein [Pyrinomonadaceae bacterium]|nr:site-2 protease family protein [Pyrinomonadaceae bacterium]